MTLSSKKGNISLIMLFVLAIGSLIGLMSTNFIQDMISSTGSLRDFYQSYYLSKWWLELWILATEKYDYGFEDQLNGSEDIIRNNLHCKKDCNLWLTITSRIRPQSDSITFWETPESLDSCSMLSYPNKIITLSWWESYILPLFADQRSMSGWTNNFLNLLENNYQLQILPETSNSTSHNIGIWIALWSGFKAIYEQQPTTGKQALYITWAIWNISIYDFLYHSNGIAGNILQTEQSIAQNFSSSTNLLTQENFNYLFITNIEDNPYSFCFKANTKPEWYTINNAIITSIWTYWATTIGLQANIKKPLPDYIINSYSTY